jgi:hypothetical protein
MKKYRPPLTDTELQELERLSKLKFSTYTEADVREEYLMPILTLLGYRKDLDYSVSREKTFKLNNLFLQVGSTEVRLDYICSIRKEYFWLIDAKKGKCKDPTKPPKIRDEDVSQTYFYSLHPTINCKYFVVSNGWYLNVYDRDEINNSKNPILSIAHTEIKDRFYELDNILAATQLIPHIKAKLLSNIEKVLSSEVSLERLEEFVKEVEKITHKVRPKVLDNFRSNAKKERESSEACWNNLIANANPFEIVQTLFQQPYTKKEINDISDALVENLVNSSEGERYIFMREILMLELKSVNYWYYINVLNFLIKLNSSSIASNYSSITSVNFTLSDNLGCSSIEQILHYWIYLLFSRFNNRRDLRLKTLFDGLFRRLFKFLFIMLKTSRDSLKEMVELSNYILLEETIAWIDYSPANYLIKSVENETQRALSAIIRKYYDKNKRHFHLNLAEQEYFQVNALYNQIFEPQKEKYLILQNELGDDWSELLFLDDIFLEFDPILAASCSILLRYPQIVEGLPEKSKVQIGIAASIECVGSAKELCQKHNLKYCEIKDAETRQKAIEYYFSPQYDPDIFLSTYLPELSYIRD